MKKCLFLLVSLASIAIINSCKKAADFNRDYAVLTGVGYYPVSTNTLVDISTNRTLGTVTFAGGYSFKTELQYFSEAPIQEINLYNTIGASARTKVSTFADPAAYSTFKKLDTLLIPYTVPTGLTSGTSIKLDIEILNTNTLSVIRTATIKTL